MFINIDKHKCRLPSFCILLRRKNDNIVEPTWLGCVRIPPGCENKKNTTDVNHQTIKWKCIVDLAAIGNYHVVGKPKKYRFLPINKTRQNSL